MKHILAGFVAIFEGFATFNIFGSQSKRYIPPSLKDDTEAFKSDAEAMKSDWDTIFGKDWRNRK